LRSERLRYHPVEPGTLEAFHGLVQDEHVRRYMMDGHVFSREWTEQRIQESLALLERRGVGIWLAYEKDTDELVGFCGFWIPPGGADPQLLYAMFERWTRRGFAMEMARAAIAQARTQPGFAEIMADVDEINAGSVRVLEKLGFERVAVNQGAFGNLLLLRFAADRDLRRVYRAARVAPAAMSAPISAALSPASRRISSLCSPSRGGRRRMAPGVLP
jgi:ribosomal-protein-alanine N-acetyltransferase